MAESITEMSVEVTRYRLGQLVEKPGLDSSRMIAVLLANNPEAVVDMLLCAAVLIDQMRIHHPHTYQWLMGKAVPS